MSSKVQELQLVQQNVQNIALQKQQIEAQLTEFNSALNELTTTQKAYRIIGKIMIASSKEKIVQDINDQKEVAQIRLKHLTKQEETLKSHMSDLQKQMVEELSEKNNE